MEKDSILAKWMEGTLSNEALKKLVSKEEYAEFIKLKKGIQLYEMTQQPLRADAYGKIKKEVQAKQKRFKIHNVYKMVGAAAAVILLVFGLNKYLSPNTFVVETAIGEQKEILLPDGTEVQLDANTTLQYNKDTWKKHRQIQLEGNAYFKVKKGATFTVNTKNGQVVVLGTKFSVSTMLDYLAVQCFEGKVQVLTDNHFVLKPQQMVQIIGNRIAKQKNNNDKPQWLKGTSRFKATPLKYVIKTIENQYNVHFVNKGIDESMLFTGSFTHHNLPLTLRVVFEASNIKLRQKGKNTYVLTK